jgi:hypothetical protein
MDWVQKIQIIQSFMGCIAMVYFDLLTAGLFLVMVLVTADLSYDLWDVFFYRKDKYFDVIQLSFWNNCNVILNDYNSVGYWLHDIGSDKVIKFQDVLMRHECLIQRSDRCRFYSGYLWEAYLSSFGSNN